MVRAKNVVILGSTGSIGINTLKVIDRFPKDFKVVGLTAYNNLEFFEKQVRKYTPSYAAVGSHAVNALKERLSGSRVKIFSADEDLEALVSLPEVDIVVIGMSGSAALKPFLKAARCGKTIAPANKEALVIAGEIIMAAAKKHGATVIPVDSEQSAIFQCLEGQNRSDVKKVHLTASGGALYNVPESKFDKLSIAQILSHPRWKMGKKITVDSATLMNKGFEVIEALRLFDLDVEQIKVVIHPEAIIHSMVEFIDGSVIAQLGITDMRLPIQYALTYPKRVKTDLPGLDFNTLGKLHFARPDLKKFPSLALAFHAARQSGTLPAVLNAADEEAVGAFLNGKIKFSRIFKVVEKIVLKHKISKSPTLADILAADQRARSEIQQYLRD